MAVLIKCVLIIQIIGLINNANGETDRNARAIFATTEQPEITMQLRGDEHDVCFHNCEMNEFPLELAEKINELKDVEGFVNNFLEDEESLTNTTTYRSFVSDIASLLGSSAAHVCVQNKAIQFNENFGYNFVCLYKL
ncbi:unnamed protein product [Diamesa serratosioi]